MVKPKPVEVLKGAMARNVRVARIKVKVYSRTDIFELALCEVLVYLLPDYIIGMDIVSDWRVFPPLSTVKQKACKSALQVMLIGCAKEGMNE